ncbi:MAG: hypothetical protein KGJ02_02670 [Verrucomicrobiota bacterium]|nr:hypothetical protein [Verrucomicrobiota bacterium]
MKNWLLFFLIAWMPVYAARTPKVLVLIIASDDLPVYRAFQDTWRAYMHTDPKHIEAYFLKATPEMDRPFAIVGDTFVARAGEGLVPGSAGILNKTLIAFKAFLPRLHEFDYVLRTNLSSFFFFPDLLEFLKTLPAKHCYAGGPTGKGSRVASGSGIILSTDVVKLLLFDYKKLFNDASEADDVLIGHFLWKKKIHFLSYQRFDIHRYDDWVAYKEGRVPHTFHFRTRTSDRSNPADLSYDVDIQRELLHMFYGIHL